ncbi:MAG: sulfotransferase [Nocardioides sp.]|uniref:sulfotransferase family protein n=1 Tax=Nocardioides sp. TaxID=35761 RepID=UPI0039E33878
MTQPDPFPTGEEGSRAPIFVVGCQRSGTTALRLMLDSHRHIACGPETRFLTGLEPITGESWERISRFGFPREYWLAKTADYFGSFHAEYAAARGKRRWADKSPLYALILPFVWELFPDAQVVHLIRDPRDVTASHRVAFGYKSALNAPRKWQRYIRQVRAAAAAAPSGRYYEMRYEDLAADRESALRALLGFLGEPWDPAMLDYENRPHDVNERYWARTRERRAGSTRRRRLDPVLAGAVRVLSQPLRRELGY